MRPNRWQLSILAGAVLALVGCVRLGFDRQPIQTTQDGGSDGPVVEQGADVVGLPDVITDQPVTPDAKTAGRYEDCTSNACAAGMDCIQSSDSTFTPFCMQRCTSTSDCGAGEVCDYMLGKAGSKHCLEPCKIDGDCPQSTHCLGYGPYPGNHCAPIQPQGAGTVCKSDLQCDGGMRCIRGYSTTARCYQVCPAADTCPATHLCSDILWESRKACLRKCAPLDSPVKCASHEICYPNPETQQAYCINAAGATSSTTCTTTGLVCVSGKICTGGKCANVCDASHPCPTAQTCTTLIWGGKTIPWKACK